VILTLLVISFTINAVFDSIKIFGLKPFVLIASYWSVVAIIGVLFVIIPEVIHDRRISRRILSNTDG
jgi:hypothetical protein